MIIGSIILILVIGLCRLCSNSDTKEGTWTKKKYYELLPVKETPDYKPDPSEVDDSKGEIECRRVLNKLFNRPFHKDRPNFLNNPVTGGKHNLELDCVDHELKIACEYNGAQHYKYIPYFHKNKQHFQTQMYRDDMKRRICKDEGYTLIEVPYTTKIKDIENFIMTELSKAGKI
jgi:hypothetical protein